MNLTQIRAHYEPLAQQASAAVILAALQELEVAQRDVRKASVLCQSRDYDAINFAATDARVNLWKAIEQAGIDPVLIKEALA